MRVPIEELVDLAALEERDGRPPSPSRIRDALPRGWVLEDDGCTARRDLRLFFRDGWILVLGLLSFGAAGVGLFWYSFPSGWAGFLRLGTLLVVLLLVGGLVAPWITRTLNKR